MIQTEYQFTLPVGYQDEEGNLHRDGMMRLATAADEITPLRDGRVQANPAYLIVILLSRVITKLGGLVQVNPKIVESLYAADLAHLQKLYNDVNQVDTAHVSAICPQCRHAFQVEGPAMGGF
jgi:hypothetical protein